MNDDNPTGEVRPMIDREPPNVDKTQGAVLGKTVLRDLRAGSSPRSLALPAKRRIVDLREPASGESRSNLIFRRRAPPDAAFTF